MHDRGNGPWAVVEYGSGVQQTRMEPCSGQLWRAPVERALQDAGLQISHYFEELVRVQRGDKGKVSDVYIPSREETVTSLAFS